MIPLVMLVTSLTSMAVGGGVSLLYRGPGPAGPSSPAAPAIMSSVSVAADACILCQVIEIITSSAPVGTPPVNPVLPPPHD